jgi:DnaJ-class molecular chaperone
MGHNCLVCHGTGEVVFTKEFGGPRCRNCGGTGVIGRETIEINIAAILDGNSVYMGGPSKASRKTAAKIGDYLREQGLI